MVRCRLGRWLVPFPCGLLVSSVLWYIYVYLTFCIQFSSFPPLVPCSWNSHKGVLYWWQLGLQITLQMTQTGPQTITSYNHNLTHSYSPVYPITLYLSLIKFFPIFVLVHLYIEFLVKNIHGLASCHFSNSLLHLVQHFRDREFLFLPYCHKWSLVL